MATAMETRQAHKRRYRISAERIVAVSLLLVLATGLSITSFTQGWIASLPYHDHLLLNARALGLVHHAHHGDALDHAQRALQSVGTAAGAAQPRPDGVVSLRPMTAQPELNSTAAYGLVGDFALPLPPEAGVLTLLAALLFAISLRYSPPSPPPRFA